MSFRFGSDDYFGAAPESKNYFLRNGFRIFQDSASALTKSELGSEDRPKTLDQMVPDRNFLTSRWTAQDKTSQLGIGVYDLIIKNTNFSDVKCESHQCNFASDDKNITMEMKRVGFDLFLNRDLNILIDINVNSILFNCKEEGPCKSGLVVHYHNDPNLIRV